MTKRISAAAIAALCASSLSGLESHEDRRGLRPVPPQVHTPLVAAPRDRDEADDRPCAGRTQIGRRFDQQAHRVPEERHVQTLQNSNRDALEEIT